MKSIFSVLAIFACAAAVAAASEVDPCAQYASCEVCVSHNLCGWCSEPVVYPDNRTGTQCAGFNSNGSNPFACNGIYSTDQCVAGYTCDLDTFQCTLASPGAGIPQAACEANCTDDGQVYLCNMTSHTCHQVPPNSPNNGSYAICMSDCIHPSSHPSSSSPSPAAETYICNTTSGQCQQTTVGHGSSLQVCNQSCSKSDGEQYMCNSFLQQCIKLPPGIKGETYAQCEAVCNPKPNPGPPSAFVGMWRGIAIQNNYKVGEWDMNFTETSAVIIDIAQAQTIKGIPSNQQTASGAIFNINITSGPGAGQVWRGIGETANRGPETFYLTAAFGGFGQPAPGSIDAAMKDGSSTVFFLSKCAGTPECVFTMPATSQKRVFERQTVRTSVSTDPCSQWSANCTECLAHALCGWCSTNVIYKDGQTGTQCAGFSSNANESNAFVCNGRYSTFDCTVGYDCDQSTDQCVPDPNPGNGLPLAECTQLCRPTPPPTPPIAQYICNITTKQCYKCNETFCPGSMPEATCAAACVKPKPGPTGLVVGSWRGLQIQNSYPLGEWEWLFNASALTVYKENVEQWSATIISYGGNVMQFNVVSGSGSGSTFSGIYSIQNQGGPLYSIMTLAVGGNNGAVPQSFSPPMETTGEYELVLAKCAGSPCSFVNP
ncbi:GPI-anchored surface protein, putative [Bodo saltans]|uniref:GPI-anchored surface protein, putative n=1 Tax=Bodo saltans TaxID=75058 RepID=A0A0S4IU01_BODSA|nr:GPI-anchored surface protein, putative [Bodo saltans]|eukprot:CUG07542.1 GPI-anchored surface protein, putative [Bodo saltans]